MNTSRGFTLLELLLVMTLVTAVAASTWVFMRPVDEGAKVTRFVADIESLRSAIKRRMASSGDMSTPYSAITSTNALYTMGVVPPSMTSTAASFGGRMDSPWGTQVQVRTWSLTNSIGTALDPVGTSAFNIRIEMPSGRSERQGMCAPLVTALAPLYPQMSYGTVAEVTSSTPGTLVIASDLPLTSARIPIVVAQMCNQTQPFTLVIADA